MSSARKTASVLVAVCSIFVSHILIADQANDSKITFAVKSAIAAERDMSVSEISVSTRDNVVKLSGLVDTALQAHKAVELAQGVNGVSKVEADDLEVTSSDSYLSDAMLTAKAKGKIAQLTTQSRISKGHRLHVETTNGVVHIFGKLGKTKDATEIRNSIAKMENVKDVKFNVYG